MTEEFVGLECSVIDFWRWALSDWKNSGTRAQLAEFYVRLAVGLQNEPAQEWRFYGTIWNTEKPIPYRRIPPQT